jgi:hypothetical protein
MSITLSQALGQSWIFGTPIYIWEQKLILVKNTIKKWAKTSFHSTDVILTKLKNNLQTLQLQMEDVDITNNLLQEEVLLQTQIQWELRREEEYWRIKSISLWLHGGDRNTNFFHKQDKSHLSM